MTREEVVAVINEALKPFADNEMYSRGEGNFSFKTAMEDRKKVMLAEVDRVYLKMSKEKKVCPLLRQN